MSVRGERERKPHVARPVARHVQRILLFLGLFFAAWLAGSTAASADDGVTAGLTDTKSVTTSAQHVSGEGSDPVEPVADAPSGDSTKPTSSDDGPVGATVEHVTTTARSLSPGMDASTPVTEIRTHEFAGDVVNWDPTQGAGLPVTDGLEEADRPASPDASDSSADADEADGSADADDKAEDDADASSEEQSWADGSGLIPAAEAGDVEPISGLSDTSNDDDSPAGASDRVSAAVTGGSTGQGGPAFADLPQLPASPADASALLTRTGVTSPPTQHAVGDPSFSPD